MRRRFAALAAAAVFALALSAAPVVAGSPAVPGDWSQEIKCGLNTYAISGTLSEIDQGGTSASGNSHGAAHLTVSSGTATNVPLEYDASGKVISYRVVGMEMFGGTANARTGRAQETWRVKFQIVGTGDSVNVVVRSGPNGDMRTIDVGTCGIG